MPYALYIASALGAAAMLLMMPRQGYTPAKFGLLLGGATLGGLWLWLSRLLPETIGLPDGAFPYYYVFSILAIGSAARVITHTKPVYAALWFVMVVLATAGLFVILAAEFMAFAMVIIYAGAILVTYLFVIMLASHAGDTAVVHTTAAADSPSGTPVMREATYDRVALEPAAAIAVGFLLLAVLLGVMFQEMQPNPAAAGMTDADMIEGYLPDRAATRIAQTTPALADTGSLHNAERIGFDLFRSHPLGLELAGVILLVALVGAVVIARIKPLPPQDRQMTA